MRVAESLTLPSELERARRVGELVIFAGAGVSMAPPANLPGFKGLAREIAQPKIPWDGRRYGTAFDRYLGDAERDAVQVQVRARQILSTSAQHTPLHEYLIGIFGAPEQVRLITTNFDGHFTSAARKVFSADIPHYFGPALPPGREFCGIAHLHGALTQSHARLVLTDRDFAEAYMAEGWAARFLGRVFADRTVLFVGYGLGDPIVRYLLHALPATGRWYGLWHEKEVDRGKDHPITPITFATSGGRRFRDLEEGLKRWYWYATAAPSDHDRELTRLIAAGPPVSPIEIDYVRERLGTEPGRNLFWRHAVEEPWFDWAASEGFLDCLTAPAAEEALASGWAAWSVEHFLKGDAPPLLRFLRGHSLALAPVFQVWLILHLCRVDTLPSLPVLRQVIALLVGQGEGAAPRRHLGWFMERLVKQGVIDEALALLRHVTRLHLIPVEKYWDKLDELAADESTLRPLATRVRTLLDPSELDQLLEEHGLQMAAANPTLMLSIGIGRLEEAYELLTLARGGQDDIDWLSYGRTAIAPSDQDRFANAEDVLIIIVRTVLDQWAVTQDERLQQFANKYSQAERTLLRRLSLYAFARCQTCDPDSLLDLATVSGWARDTWIRPEFYEFLTSHYAAASEVARGRFVSTVRNDDWVSGEQGEHAAHARFSLAHKLLRLAPDSLVTQEFAAAEALEHPNWRESDHDGFLSRVEVGWGREEPSPIESSVILGWSAEVAVAEITQILSESDGHRLGDPVLGSVQQAARTDPDHAIGVYREALRLESPKGEAIAVAVLYGLRDAELEETDQRKFLAIPLPEATSDRLIAAYSRVMEKWSEDLDEEVTSDLLSEMDRMAGVLFQRSRTISASVEGDSVGWTDRALNHPGGGAARVWWRLADARNRVDGQSVLSIDDLEKEHWTMVLADDTYAGDHARPILGMAADRLSTGDVPWSSEIFFPCFDPRAGWDRAAQLWDGRLMQSQWSWTTVELLRPYCDPLFKVSAQLLPSRGRQLGDWLAFLVVNKGKSGITLRQLQIFVENASEETRRQFAFAVPRQLEGVTVEQRGEVWQGMLRKYWRDRTTNMPIPLTAQEVSTMISWIPALAEFASEAVDELLSSPSQGLEHADSVLFQWSDSEHAFVEEHPDEAVKVLVYLLSAKAVPSWMAERAVQLIERALENGAEVGSARQAAESLMELTVAARPLVERLVGRD